MTTTREIGSDTADGGGSEDILDQVDRDDTLTAEDEFRFSIGASPADDPSADDGADPDIGDNVFVTFAPPAPPMDDPLFPADHWSVDLTGASDSFLQ